MPGTEPNWPDKCCLNCHFLAARVGRLHYVMDAAQRKAVFRGWALWDYYGERPEVLCYRDVWGWERMVPEEECDESELSKLLTELVTEAQGDCFFYPYTGGMTLDTAVQLERRADDRREAEEDRALTRKAFKGSKTALWAFIIATVVTLGWNILAHFLDRPADPPPAVIQPAATPAETPFQSNP